MTATTDTYTVTRYAYAFTWQQAEQGADAFAKNLTQLGGKGWRIHTLLDRPGGLGALLEQSFTETIPVEEDF